MLMLSSCAVMDKPVSGQNNGESIAAKVKEQSAQYFAQAILYDGKNNVAGKALFSQNAGKVIMHIDVILSEEGLRGMHLHEKGVCEGPDFTSAGGHWNPAGRGHGTENPMGPHHGDLPNIMTLKMGKTKKTIILDKAEKIEDFYDADGTSIVIHAGPDDMKTDPSGNSGPRIICGVIRPI
ncbi:hypothetical protein LPB140_05265 [Sphingorhabdus lutea]|uniref:Superoxide dismutase copper/zinc binding domain-containing protein n=2 Tax=Sphingorhabdus lutea TaxID=1913578 RepID=A0A1L3JEP3_9SPHN|nr:hypothetical protein LPB140_05265 [Sphingorhabdus lutea]